MSQTDRQRRVSATFLSRYFQLLITNPQELVPMYLPKAQFNHDGPTKSVQGPAAIAAALARLYPEPNHGRITVQDMNVRPTERGRFAIVVSGTYFRRGRSGEGETFRHVLELQEHADSNGVFGIYADSRHESKQEPLQWALETPPMDAKPEPVAPPPALVQPPTTEAVVATAPVAPAAAPAAAAVPAEPAAPVSFADMIRHKASQPAATAPAKVTAKQSEAKQKPAHNAKEDKDHKGSARPATAEKGEGRRGPKEGTTQTKEGDGAAPNKAADRKAQRNHNRFDIIVKGLPTTADRKFVVGLFPAGFPVAKVQIRSNPDKKDAAITRTFAFVLVDREGKDAAADVAIPAGIKHINDTYTKERIQAEVMREKPTTTEVKKERAPKPAAAAATTPAPQ